MTEKTGFLSDEIASALDEGAESVDVLLGGQWLRAVKFYKSTPERVSVGLAHGDGMLVFRDRDVQAIRYSIGP